MNADHAQLGLPLAGLCCLYCARPAWWCAAHPCHAPGTLVTPRDLTAIRTGQKPYPRRGAA